MRKPQVEMKRLNMFSKLKESIEGSLKAKLIIGFVIMGILLGVVSVVSNLILKNSVGEFDSMIQTTVIANSVPDGLKEIAVANGLLEAYALYKKEETLKDILSKTNKAKDTAASLKLYLKQEDASSKIDELETQIKFCEDNITIVSHFDNKILPENILP